MGSAMQTTTTVAALGRVAQLGDFYDVRSESFVKGLNLFKNGRDEEPALLSDYIDTISTSHTDLKYIQGESYDEKCRHLGVNCELKLSVLAGLCGVGSLIGFLKDRKRSSRFSSCTVAYSIKTDVERIVNVFDPNLKKFMCSEAVAGAGDMATHVVTEVQYGANAMVTFRKMLEDTFAASKVEGTVSATAEQKLEALVTAVAGAAVTGAAKIDNKNQELKKLENLSFEVFGDISSSDDIPLTIEEALIYLKSVPTRVEGTGGGRGVPLCYGLFPIDMLKMYLQLEMAQDQLVQSINESVVQSFVDLFDAIAKQKQELENLRELGNQFAFVVAYEDKLLLAELIRDLDLYQTDLRSELKSAVTIARHTSEDTLLKGVHVKYTHQDLRSPSSIKQSVERVAKSLGEATSFATVMRNEGVHFIMPSDSLNNVLLLHRDCDVYVLFTNRAHRRGAAAGDWTTNQRLFVSLCRGAKKEMKKETATHVFYVHDTSPLENGVLLYPKVKISQYKNGKMVQEDLTVSPTGSSKPVAKPSGIWQFCMYKPNKRAAVELPCPSGQCANEQLTWHCAKCDHVLEFGFDGNFYCECGKSEANGFLYRCDDLENHGLGFEMFEKPIIDALLAKLQVLQEINILILGETGVGKSTWINGFVNYLTYPSLQLAAKNEPVSLIPSKFTMVDPKGRTVIVRSGPESRNEVTEIGNSATQFPKSYVFPRGNVLIRIVDTPGIGDTRGIEQDSLNFANIMHHISFLDKIHGICVLLKPQESRTTITFQFCIKELLTQLHKDAAKNIVFCFTHARETLYRPGDTLTLLQRLLAENPGIELALSTHTMYCVDNESVRFLAALQNGVTFLEEEINVFEKSWGNSVAEINRLLKHINGLEPHKTKGTISLNHAHRLIHALTEPIGTIAMNIGVNIALAEQHKEEIETSLKQKKKFEKDLHIPKMDVDGEELDRPATVCLSRKCSKAHHRIGTTKPVQLDFNVCHEDCHEVKVGPTESYPQRGLKKCVVMRKSLLTVPKCSICGCSWDKHLHMTYKVKYVPSVVNSEVEEKLQTTENYANRQEQMLKQTERRIDALQEEQQQLADIHSKLAAFLNENAIAPYNDTILSYMEYWIDVERDRGTNVLVLKRYRNTLRILTEKIELLKKALTDGDDSAKTKVLQPSEIKDQIQNLYTLPTQGKTLKKLVAIVNSAADKSMFRNGLTYVPKYDGYTRGLSTSSGGDRMSSRKKVPWYHIGFEHLENK